MRIFPVLVVLVFIPPTALAEWELPFTLHVDFLRPIGGFSPLLSSTYYPPETRTASPPLLERQAVSLLTPSSSSCHWNCFDSSSFPSPSLLPVDPPLNASSSCPPYYVGEPLVPEIALPYPDASGQCETFAEKTVLALENATISCVLPLTGSCTEMRQSLATFWTGLGLPEAVCNCDNCEIPMVEFLEPISSVDGACSLPTTLSLYFTEREGHLNSYIVSRSSSEVASDGLAHISVDVRFFAFHETSTESRFWSRRGRFYCPSEVACWRELWYPLSLVPLLSWPALALCTVTALVVTTLIYYMRIAIVTVSDSCSLGLRDDLSGPLLRDLAIKEKQATVEEAMVPDERLLIESTITDLADRNDVVITTGGTGLAPRDVTPEATLNVIHKRCTGLETALHVHGLKNTPMAALSRLVVGIRDQCLIVNLPGSKNGAKDGWEVLSPLLDHAVSLIQNKDDGLAHKAMAAVGARGEEPVSELD